MVSSAFRFDSDILRRLGEELNPNLDQGILELVKNAFDADARVCTVTLHEVDSRGGTISVIDDGNGLTEQDIRDGWLILGRSLKRTSDLTALGRRPAGNKGLGRLAALRMGSRASLSTRPRSDSNRCFSVELDWNQFTGHLVEEVPIEVVARAASARDELGTAIEIHDLRTRLSRPQVKRLARALLLLADPFTDDPSAFRAVLIAPEYDDLGQMVGQRYFRDAEYHLVASVDDEGFATAQVLDFRGNVLYTADHERLASRRGGQPYRCPPTKFDFWAFILNPQSFSTRATTLAQVREWLLQFGGVHLYINGIRVGAQGGQGNDWLDLNLRRTQSPEERPSTNTSIGRVAVDDKNGVLTQKTDRSGLIETDAFEEIRAFSRDATEFLAQERLAVAERRRRQERDQAKEESERARGSLAQELASVPGEAGERSRSAFQTYRQEKEKETRALRQEVQLYRTLATAGITAATFAHESRGNPIKIIRMAVSTIKRRQSLAMSLGDYTERIAEPLAMIARAADGLEVLSSATLRLVEADKRRNSRIDIHAVIQDVLATYKPFLSGRDVTVSLELMSGAPYLRGSAAAFESILTNLLNNALTAFERSESTKRAIHISTDVDGDSVVLVVGDNGPGITDIAVEAIWLPGQTTAIGGTGLGLTIVRDAAADLGGTASVQARGMYGGATFQVALPMLGVELK